jgi:hypothetical protein
VDVAIRFGRLADSSAIARRIGAYPMVIAAAPPYLEQHGMPTSPADLAEHAFVMAGPAMAKGLLLRKDGNEISVQLRGMLSVTGSKVAINAGVAGMGIVAASLPSLQPSLSGANCSACCPIGTWAALRRMRCSPAAKLPSPQLVPLSTTSSDRCGILDPDVSVHRSSPSPEMVTSAPLWMPLWMRSVKGNPEHLDFDIQHAGAHRRVIIGNLSRLFKVGCLVDRHTALIEFSVEATGLLHEGAAHGSQALLVQFVHIIDVIRESGLFVVLDAGNPVGPGRLEHYEVMWAVEINHDECSMRYRRELSRRRDYFGVLELRA